MLTKKEFEEKTIAFPMEGEILSREKFDSLEYYKNSPKVYLVGFWAHYGVIDYPYAGKYVWDEWSQDYVPLVFDYDDHNGTADEYEVRKITDVTTGGRITWTFNKGKAEWIASCLEKTANKT